MKAAIEIDDAFCREIAGDKPADVAAIISRRAPQPAKAGGPPKLPTPLVFPPTARPSDDWMHAGHYDELKVWATKKVTALTAERDALREKYESAVSDYARTETQRDEAQAKVTKLEAHVRQIENDMMIVRKENTSMHEKLYLREGPR